MTADNTLANGGNYIDKLLPVQARFTRYYRYGVSRAVDK